MPFRSSRHDSADATADDTAAQRRGRRPGSVVSSAAAPLARSVLACPADVALVVDGVDDVLGDLPASGTSGSLGLQDVGGVPTFSAPSGVRLVRASGEGRRALLTLTSALGRAGSPDRDLVLTLGGRLRRTGTDRCECCPETRESLVLVVDLVMLARGEERADPVRIPAEDFGSPGLTLNAGFLQRARDHADEVHHDELRLAAADLTGTPVAEILGASLTELSADGLELRWVDVEGAHVVRRDFPRRALGTEDLGELLRGELHPDLC